MDLLNIKPHRMSYGVKGKHFLFYGPPSTRKTTVGTNFPNALLLATEVGYQFIPDVVAVNIDSWYAFTNVIRELKKQDVKDRYDTIVIDTVGLLSDMCVAFVLNKLGVENIGDAGFGKGWIEYRKEFTKQINTIAQLGYGIVFLDHSKEERDEKGTLISAKPKMDNTSSNAINALVDFIFFLNKERVDSENENSPSSVFAYSDLPSSVVTKSRARYMPKRIEFTFDNLENELKKAVLKELEEIGVQISDENEKEFAEGQKPIIKSTDHRTLDEIKDSIISIGPKLVDAGLEDKVRIIMVDALGNIKISQATEIHREALLAIEFSLQSLLEGYNEQGDSQ